MNNVYELTKFSQQKTRASAALRPMINTVISDMKRGHFSNEKTITNNGNVLRAAGAPQKTIANKPVVREVRVTQDVRIFFCEGKNANGTNTLTLLCMGHMNGSNVNLYP